MAWACLAVSIATRLRLGAMIFRIPFPLWSWVGNCPQQNLTWYLRDGGEGEAITLRQLWDSDVGLPGNSPSASW